MQTPGRDEGWRVDTIVEISVAQWIKNTLFVSYFTGYNFGLFVFLPVIKVDTVC